VFFFWPIVNGKLAMPNDLSLREPSTHLSTKRGLRPVRALGAFGGAAIFADVLILAPKWTIDWPTAIRSPIARILRSTSGSPFNVVPLRLFKSSTMKQSRVFWFLQWWRNTIVFRIRLATYVGRPQ